MSEYEFDLSIGANVLPPRAGSGPAIGSIIERLQNKTKRHGTNDAERPRRLDSAGVAIGAAGRGQMPTGQATAGIRRSFQPTSARMAGRVTKGLGAIRDVVDVFEAWETIAQ
jgi:hypothetical protein